MLGRWLARSIRRTSGQARIARSEASIGKITDSRRRGAKSRARLPSSAAGKILGARNGKPSKVGMAGRSRRSMRACRPGPAAGLLVVAALLGAGCGQIGAAHDAAGGQAEAAGAYPGTGGDTGGVAKGPQFSGDPTLPQKGHQRRRIIITTVTTTASDPTTSPIPQFHLRVAITNTSGPLYACPVQGPFHVGDDFGQPRYTTNPPHPHGGNDIFAPRGTPVIAPFDGYAYVDTGGLGGRRVIVRGRDGLAYNAHLDSYGQLGQVRTGTVVGYVGNSGDAVGGATHDHFEWHPYHPTIKWVSPYGYSSIDSWSPPAVDPYPYLR